MACIFTKMYYFFLFRLRREYPCDHYTSVINVTLLMTGCPRVNVHSTAIQLLQILDKRFFGSVGPLQGETDKGKLIESEFFACHIFFPLSDHMSISLEFES